MDTNVKHYHEQVASICQKQVALRAAIDADLSLSPEERCQRMSELLDRQRDMITCVYNDEIKNIQTDASLQRDELDDALNKALKAKQDALNMNIANLQTVMEEKIAALTASVPPQLLWYERPESIARVLIPKSSVMLCIERDSCHISFCYAINIREICKMPVNIKVRETQGIVHFQAKPSFCDIHMSFYRDRECFVLSAAARYFFYLDDKDFFQLRPTVVHEIVPTGSS